MTRVLRLDNSQFPLIRVLYATTFGADGSGPWTEAEYWSATTPVIATGGGSSQTSNNGIQFDECSRQALPGIGEATLFMEYGIIDGASVEPYDLKGKHIRIQAARRPDNQTSSTQWRTIWLGRCEVQDDVISAASAIKRGTRIYRCVDLLRSYLTAYPMDRHANYAVTGALAFGHPGYNYDRDTPNVASGNKDVSDATFAGPDTTAIACFGLNDVAAGKTTRTWTDAEAVENVLKLRRVAGDPVFDLDATAGILDGATPIQVQESDSAWSILVKMLDRRRGKGIGFFDWDDDSASSMGAIDVKLRVRPQLYSHIYYTYPSGNVVKIDGAESKAEYFTTVDLQGDHRVVDEAFQLRSTADSAIDELTTESERIEVAVTASGSDGTIAYRWTEEIEAAWLAALDVSKSEEVYRPVLQYFGPKRSAGVVYKNGDGASGLRSDYWTDTAGAISIEHTTVTAPQMIELMDDLPLYEGYDYSLATPAPSGEGAKDGKPRRRKPLVLVKTTTNRFIPPADYVVEGGAQLSVDDDGLWVEWRGDETTGYRSIRGSYSGTASRSITEASLTFTIGLRMPQRARFVSTTGGAVRRKRSVRIPDSHLWIGHPGAIWDIDGSTANADGCNAKRIGGDITDDIEGKILRDDRAALARIHFLMWEWYRSDSPRASATWAIRDCGLLPSWQDVAGTQQSYPKLGQIVTTMQAGGSEHQVQSPISRVDYSHRTGETTWHTDWTEFDYGAA